MGEIKSTLSIASQQAGQMSTASNTLASVQAPQQQAEQTTITGNANAKQTVQSISTAVNSLVSVLNGDIQNISSVASEFARVDQEQSTGFDPIGDLRI